MVDLDNITIRSYPTFCNALLLIAFILWNVALQFIYSMCMCYPRLLIIPFYIVHPISTICDLCGPPVYW
jgi:hypothetical protein